MQKFAIFFVLLGLCLNRSFATLTIQVEPKTTECFGVDSPGGGTKIKVVFYVLRGGLLDIDLRVFF
jgi:hypothetical protein